MLGLFFHFTITFVAVCVMEGECEVITGLNRTTERGNALICSSPGLLVCNSNDCLLPLHVHGCGERQWCTQKCRSSSSTLCFCVLKCDRAAGKCLGWPVYEVVSAVAELFLDLHSTQVIFLCLHGT